MANKHSTLTSLFSDIADAIRAKAETTEQINADDFPDAILSINTKDADVAHGIVTLSQFTTNSVVLPIDTIGFTPSVFILRATFIPSAGNSVCFAYYISHEKGSIRGCSYLNSSKGWAGGSSYTSVWTSASQTGTLNTDGTNIKFQASTTYAIRAGDYEWIAIR